MQMTEEEIVRRYKQADNKRDSIRILAELNACPKQTIRDILEANGLGVPKVGGRYTKQAKALKEKMEKAAPTTCVAPEPVTVWPEAPNEVLNAAIERLIEIEGQLEELQRKRMALDAQIGELENRADRFRAWIEATREAKRKEE